MASDQDLEQIELSSLRLGMPGVTELCGGALAEAAAVCLEHTNHKPGVVLSLQGAVARAFQLHWQPVSDQQRACYMDLQDATEDGACAISLVVLKRSLGFEVVERSRKGTGFDYWVGRNSELPMQEKARLEVSGILEGNESAIKKRMTQKISQISITNKLAPGIVSIVEFSLPKACLERINEQPA